MTWWAAITGQTSGTIGTWVGGLCGLVGLYLVFRQAKQANSSASSAKTAADLAKDAADAASRAVAALSSKINLSSASYAGGQLSTLLYMIQHKHFKEALINFLALKRAILQAHPSDELHSEGCRMAFNAIESQLTLAYSGDPKFKESKVIKAVQGLVEILNDLEKKSLIQKTEN